jgi:hypothetical protein
MTRVEQFKIARARSIGYGVIYELTAFGPFEEAVQWYLIFAMPRAAMCISPTKSLEAAQSTW